MGDLLQVAACLEGSPVTVHLGFGLGDRLTGRGCGPIGVRVAICICHGLNRGLDPVRPELPGQPVVQARKHVTLADEDVERVGDLVGQGVLGGEPAPVVGHLVRPVALHLPVADAACKPAGQHVHVAGPEPLTRSGHVPTADDELLHLREDLRVDDRRVDDLVGVDPLARFVPPHLGHVAERDVGHVDQHLVLTLAVPHLPAGVARVGQDRAYRELAPCAG